MLPRYHLLDSFRITQKEYTFNKTILLLLITEGIPIKFITYSSKVGSEDLGSRTSQLLSPTLCAPQLFLLFPFFALLYYIFMDIILSNTFINVKEF